MKKVLFLFFSLMVVLGLAACSDGTPGNAVEEKEDPAGNKAGSEENTVEAEVKTIKYYEWLEEATGNETITVYAEIENTGDTNIDAGSAKITYLDADGGVIAVNESQISPRFIKAGSTGYVSANIEGDIDQYEDLGDVEIEVTPKPFLDAEIVEFTTKDEKLNVGIWREESAKISVTGFFENESDTNFIEDDTTAIVGLYDKDDNFLAAESMYQGQGFSLDPNGETSFEVAGGSPLPPEVGKEVDRAEVKAIGIENMEDYWW